MKKMNNKGFSLVELIVVVLIMAIIAVALAPQVMKWVENSRKATDVQNYGHVAQALEVSYAKEVVFKGGDYYIDCPAGVWQEAPVKATKTSASGDTTSDAAKAIIASMKSTLGNEWAGANGTMRMRSKRYTTDSGAASGIWVSMVDGHLVRCTYVVEDVES